MSYKNLESQDFLISAESKVKGAWKNNTTSTITTFNTVGTQTGGTSGDFYYNVDAGGDVEFAVAYGNYAGAGSNPFNPDAGNNSPSKVTYSQMRTLLLGDEKKYFEFVSGSGTYTPNGIFAIVLNRSSLQEKIKAGSLSLSIGSGGYNTVLKDNSNSVNSVEITDGGRVFEIYSGSAENAKESTSKGSYGKIYPDVGIIILNVDAIIEMTDVVSGNSSNIRNSLITNLESFTLKTEETVTSNFIFARARNNEFNYTTNPSYIDNSTGELKHEVLISSPETYITSVGLYNDNQDLLAVAKLSRPLLKNSTKEALIRIKLDY